MVFPVNIWRRATHITYKLAGEGSINRCLDLRYQLENDAHFIISCESTESSFLRTHNILKLKDLVVHALKLHWTIKFRTPS